MNLPRPCTIKRALEIHIQAQRPYMAGIRHTPYDETEWIALQKRLERKIVEALDKSHREFYKGDRFFVPGVLSAK